VNLVSPFLYGQAIAEGVSSADNQPIELTTLSVSPRVFEVSHFFSAQDADDLIRNALTITEPDFALKRSTTGTKGAAVGA
jgi:hypothetical protein